MPDRDEGLERLIADARASQEEARERGSLAPAAHGEAPPAADAKTRVCAWCDRVEVLGAWREAAVPEEEREAITHGICPDCRARAEAAAGRPPA